VDYKGLPEKTIKLITEHSYQTIFYIANGCTQREVETGDNGQNKGKGGENNEENHGGAVLSESWMILLAE
jgi:hypothetical protein